jgi:hypothetical protein
MVECKLEIEDRVIGEEDARQKTLAEATGAVRTAMSE